MSNPIEDAGKQSLKDGFQKLFRKIGGAIEDAASLEVTTFSGDFEYKVSDVVKNNIDKVEIENVLKSLTANANAKLDLVAYTNIKIDSDVTTFVKNDLSEAHGEMLKMHQAMIESSKEARQSVIQLVKGLIDK